MHQHTHLAAAGETDTDKDCG
jgi:hypothetical protein